MTTTSYKEIETSLKTLKENPIPAEELGYALLKAFGMTDTSVKRVRNGKMNLAKYDGILVKKSLAYRITTSDQMTIVLEEMKADDKIAKASARIIAVSDGTTLLAYDPKDKENYDNRISKLWLDFQFFLPLAGVERYKTITENIADIRAAEKMSKLYDEIRLYNEITSKEDVHNLNIFMTRLLFCFFAEDTGIFDKNLFTGSIQRFTQPDGSDLSEYLDACFNIMDKDIRLGIPSAIAQFPYVNGGLFRHRITIPKMGFKARKIILECGELNWSDINPDIFGSMIQAVVTPEMRAGLGMHYTSVPNIMKLIGPLFLNDLYEAFDEAKENEKKLNALLVRMSKIKFFDPACGSGNFLIISYKELRKLEILIWKRLRELTRQAIIPFVSIQLHQFYGIEIDDFCHETAILSLWLAEHQMNSLFSKEFAVKIQALPLRPSGNIFCANACRVDWEDVCPHTKEEEVYIMGNPPYLGSGLQLNSHKSDMALVFNNIANYKKLDYISCWFYLSSIYIRSSKAKSAFVTTNSICQGEQVSLLWKIISEELNEISFAYSSFLWKNNAKSVAAVAVTIIGLRNKSSIPKRYYSDSQVRIVENINYYLINGANIYVEPQRESISGFPEMIKGSSPGDDGNLLLSQGEKDNLIRKYPTAQCLIKKYIGADEFVNGKNRYCLWITEENLQLACSIPLINERFEGCRQFRLKSKKEATQRKSSIPYFFDERKYSELRSIIIPQTGSEKREYLPMGLLDANSVASNAVRIIYNNDMCLFGIIISKIHMIWVRAVAGRLKNDMQYSNTLCYNTFPFPPISEEKKKEISDAAEDVICIRAEHCDKTLAELYDPDKMPSDLRDTHHKLDLIVESCYRKEPFSSDEERLEHLFKLYEKMTNKN